MVHLVRGALTSQTHVTEQLPHLIALDGPSLRRFDFYQRIARDEVGIRTTNHSRSVSERRVKPYPSLPNQLPKGLSMMEQVDNFSGYACFADAARFTKRGWQPGAKDLIELSQLRRMACSR